MTHRSVRWIALLLLGVLLLAAALSACGQSTEVPTETQAHMLTEEPTGEPTGKPPATATDTPTSIVEPAADASREPTAADRPADCRAAGLPDIACTGVSANDEWTPLIQEFDGVEMALVPAGCFRMGDDSGLAEEQPVHEICFDQPFWIDLTEVTVAQFTEFLNGQGEPVDSYEGWLDHRSQIPAVPTQLVRQNDRWVPLPGQDDHPLQSITWVGADAYCAWREARLPTEAEWEYAARGPDNLIYPWGNEFIADKVVRVYVRTEVPKVGSKPQGASWVGALDLSSSLFEWVSSLYHPYPYDASDGREAGLDMDGSSNRVLRGSSWYHPDGMQDNVSATARMSAPPHYTAWYFGLRCVRSLDTPQPTPSETPGPQAPASEPTRTPASTSSPAPVLAQEGPFVQHTLEKGLNTVASLYVVDIDSDGDNDILGAAEYSNEIAWWRNEGGTPIAWTRQTIDDSFAGSISVHALDIDGDSDIDVVGAAFQAGEVAWWRNEGGDPIVWTKQPVGQGFEGAHVALAADLDGDGDSDILGTDAEGDRVIWWENDNPAGNGSSWIEYTIHDGFRFTQTVDAADIDGDGDLDVVAGAGGGNEVAWWRNEGGKPLVWVKQSIQQSFHWAHWVHVCDVDGDGRLDVLGAAYSDDTIAWWRNSGGDPIVWERQNIDSSFLGVLTAHAADLDADGDMDILGTANNASELSWWRNERGTPIVWNKQEIRAKTFGGAWGLHAGDLDGDGDIDIVGGGTNEVTWWENTLREPGVELARTAADSAADCAAAGLPETACTGISANDEWTPLIRQFDGVEMALVPAGCFTMGSTDEQIEYAMDELLDRRAFYADEQPAHQQCFTEPFWVDVYEVTNGQYGSYDVRPGDDLPREYISWFDSAAHCASRGARLPTEAEWEYAARGPDSLIFPWGNEFDSSLLNYCDITCSSPGADTRVSDGYPLTAPVGSFPGGISWVGALDMSGNVWEWTSNLLYEYPYRAHDGREVDPDTDSTSLRTLRGGAWVDNPFALRAANRNEHAPVDQTTVFGFRCARSFGATKESAETIAQGSPSPAISKPPSDAQLGDTWIRPTDKAVMVFAPGGSFAMGTGTAGRADGYWAELPQHAVALDGFWMDKFEVTNAQFADFLQAFGNQEEGGVTWIEIDSEFCLIEQVGDVVQPKEGYADHPAIDVSWYGAQAFCQWVGGRLPTEAEWEYAARGPENLIYPWGDEYDCTRGNFHDWTEPIDPEFLIPGERGCDGFDFTSPVGTFPSGASWCGALDMAGNVYEWVADWGLSFYPSGPQVNPTGPAKGTEKVVRGGSWNNHHPTVRTAFRGHYRPLNRSYYIGFRCVNPLAP